MTQAERAVLQLENDAVLAAEEALEVWRGALKGNAFVVDDGLTVRHVDGTTENALAMTAHKSGRAQEIQVALDKDATGIALRRKHVNEDGTVPINKALHGKSKDALLLRAALQAEPPGLVVANANATI